MKFLVFRLLLPLVADAISGKTGEALREIGVNAESWQVSDKRSRHLNRCPYKIWGVTLYVNFSVLGVKFSLTLK
jgi:hypothetical protein